MAQARIIVDKITARMMRSFTVLSVLLMFLIGLGLFLKALPILKTHNVFQMLSSEIWRPFKGEFGFLPYIMGTLWVTVIAIAISFPLCVLSSIYFFEYAPQKLKQFILPLIDLLAGIPPVVYGVWGVLTIVPFISDHLAPHFVEYSSGYSVLAGGVVLSVMIFPLVMSLLGEVFSSISTELRDASLSVGATKWQTTKLVLLRKALPGIMAALILAISRALGETIAVLMVCGNIAAIPHSVFDSGYPLPALIANNYGEMLSVPMYDAALMLAAFILFLIIVIFNVSSRFVSTQLEKYFKL
jgi:phosphate transport system permease protein